METSLLVTLLVFAFGAVFIYFVGAVIIQALRLSIIQVKSDVKIKMDKHQHELEQQQVFLESKRLMLQGKTKEEVKKEGPKKDIITTIELGIDGDISGLKKVLESIGWVKKFVIFKNSILLDIEGDRTPTQVIEEIESRAKVSITQVNFAKNPEKTSVRGKGS